MTNTFISRLRSPENRTVNILLFLVIALAAYLRLHRLGYQSLWLDELYTMRETDPSISWKESLSLIMQYENKSPLYFAIVKLFCSVFGHSGYAARFVSVLGGVAGVYAMYLLGREILNKRTGLLAALLTAVNYFHIFYSQEARGYIFLFLFATLSYVYLLRFFKASSARNAAWFGIYGMLCLHFHPFGLMVLMSQFVVALIVFLRLPKENKLHFFKLMALGFGIVLLGFSPMIPALMSSNEIGSSWIPEPTPDFYLVYFRNFFYDSQLLQPFLYASLILFLLFSVIPKQDEERGEFEPGFIFMLLGAWLMIGFLVPYIRSVKDNPVLVVRYMIMVLPALLLMLAIGQGWIKSVLARYTLTACFVILSVLELFVFQNYYLKATKAQFRHLTEFIKSADNEAYPIINDRTGWHQQYYLTALEVKNRLITVNRELILDSIVNAVKSNAAPKGFWLVGAHGEQKPSVQRQAQIDSLFYPEKSKDFNDAWGVLYLPRKK